MSPKTLLRIAAVLAAAFLMFSAAAQQRLLDAMQPIERPDRAPKTIGEVAAKLREVQASVIAVDWTTDSFVIPVAGNAAGSGGTYFRSDVAFNNDALVDQRIAVGWLAQGQNNCAASFAYFNLPANAVTIADDFVGQSLGKSGIGAILVLAVGADGTLDDEALIDGYSRIWTRQPGSNGTVSQNFTAIALEDSLGSLPATLMGLKQSSSFRTNVGVVNFDDTAQHTWSFQSIPTGVTTNVTVPPCSMALTSAANGSASPSGNAAFTVRSDGFGFWWSGFGSSTDNVTGDGWVSRAIQ
jgi:hypothetical protein